MIENLLRFYDFGGKVVLSIGAGGGRPIDFGGAARKIVAVDSDARAIEQLKQAVHEKGVSELFCLLRADFEDVVENGDVVFFDFCLHEMKDPPKALAHARELASDIIVFDHLPDSDWAFYAAEEDKVLRSTEAVARSGVRRQARFETVQRFGDYEELLAKVSSQGPVAIERIARFKDAVDIVIPMTYGIALL